jgi:hypothetical protein
MKRVEDPRLVKGIATYERIMDLVASELGLDPVSGAPEEHA